MAESRIKREKKIILVLTALVILVYGLFLGVNAIAANNAESASKYIEMARITDYPETIEIEDQVESYTLVKDGANWDLEGNTDISISAVDVAILRSTIEYLEEGREIRNSKDSWAIFGLDNPQKKLTLSMKDGSSITYLIGDYNPILGEYYVGIEGEDVCMLIADADIQNMCPELLSIIGAPSVADIDADDLTGTVVQTSSLNYVIKHDEDSATVLTSDESFETKLTSAQNILSALIYADYTCMTHERTDEDDELYGIDKPYVMLGFVLEDGSKYVVFIGEGEDGNYYMNQNDDALIYQIDEAYVTKLLTRIDLNTLKAE